MSSVYIMYFLCTKTNETLCTILSISEEQHVLIKTDVCAVEMLNNYVDFVLG